MNGMAKLKKLHSKGYKAFFLLPNWFFQENYFWACITPCNYWKHRKFL